MLLSDCVATRPQQDPLAYSLHLHYSQLWKSCWFLRPSVADQGSGRACTLSVALKVAERDRSQSLLPEELQVLSRPSLPHPVLSRGAARAPSVMLLPLPLPEPDPEPEPEPLRLGPLGPSAGDERSR